jgi:uncharacterized protein
MSLKTKLEKVLRFVELKGVPNVSKSRGGVKNITAFSGGVDSSLAAALVQRVFPQNSVACIGISPSLSDVQLTQARQVAKAIGVELWEYQTTEGEHEEYVKNEGKRYDFGEKV